MLPLGNISYRTFVCPFDILTSRQSRVNILTLYNILCAHVTRKVEILGLNEIEQLQGLFLTQIAPQIQAWVAARSKAFELPLALVGGLAIIQRFVDPQ